jgi:hypothetical protein
LNTLLFNVLGCNVKVECKDSEARALLLANYGHMRAADLEPPDVSYTVHREEGSSALLIVRDQEQPLVGSNVGEFLFLFEKDMTVRLQELRRDLYFVHSAVLEFAGKALMLVGASGSGKSTTAWALLHHGFRYLSDELAPVDLKAMKVHPYAHALCLKDQPPGFYPLPEKTLSTPNTLHVPIEALPAGVGSNPAPLTAIFFLCGRQTSEASVQPIRRAEAGARLLAHALNPLAHSGDGLDGAMEMTRRTAQFKLFTADLPATCSLVKDTLKGLFRRSVSAPLAVSPLESR